MIPKIDYRDEKYPLSFRLQLANINWDIEIAFKLQEEMDNKKNKVSVLLDEEIKELVKIYRWWFSEEVMYSKYVVELLNENGGVLWWFFGISNITEKYDEVDKYLEELLLNKGISLEDIWNFLAWKPWRWFYDDMMEAIYEQNEDWYPILSENRGENIRLQKKYIEEHFSDLLNYIEEIKA